MSGPLGGGGFVFDSHCVPRNSLLSVEHTLINCVDFDIILQSLLQFLTSKISYNIHPKRIISFTHALGLTNNNSMSGMI